MKSSAWTEHLVGPAMLLRNFTLEAILHARSRNNFPVTLLQHVLFFNCVEQICGLYNAWGSTVPVPDELITVMPNYSAKVHSSTKFNLKVHIGIICYLCTQAIRDKKAHEKGDAADKHRTPGIQLVDDFAESVLSRMTRADGGRHANVRKENSSLVTPMFRLRGPPGVSVMPRTGLSLPALSEFLIEKIEGKKPEWRTFFAEVDKSIADFDVRMAAIADAPKCFEDMLGEKGECTFPGKKETKKPENDGSELGQQTNENSPSGGTPTDNSDSSDDETPNQNWGDADAQHEIRGIASSTDESEHANRKLFPGWGDFLPGTSHQSHQSQVDAAAEHFARDMIKEDTDAESAERLKKEIAAGIDKALESAKAAFEKHAATTSEPEEPSTSIVSPGTKGGDGQAKISRLQESENAAGAATNAKTPLALAGTAEVTPKVSGGPPTSTESARAATTTEQAPALAEIRNDTPAESGTQPTSKELFRRGKRKDGEKDMEKKKKRKGQAKPKSRDPPNGRTLTAKPHEVNFNRA